MKRGDFRSIVVLVGAGMSVSAGIPDFRGSTGVYKRFGASLDRPEQLFELDFYRRNPEPFRRVCREVLASETPVKPTAAHRFLKWLEDIGALLHVFTQNIDGLERAAGLSPARLTECHGHTRTFSCSLCEEPAAFETIEAFINADDFRCECGGLVKPDITFFGEELPKRFINTVRKMSHADAVLVIGSSMKVAPFNLLPAMAMRGTPIFVIDPSPVQIENVEDFEWFRGAADDVTEIIRAFGSHSEAEVERRRQSVLKIERWWKSIGGLKTFW